MILDAVCAVFVSLFLLLMEIGFMGVSDLLIKHQFIVYGASEVFKAPNLFNCFVMDGGGNQSRGVCEV